MRRDNVAMALAERVMVETQIRVVESVHRDIHDLLLQWGRWGHGLPDVPILATPAIWDLPGEGDPDRDPDAVPESPLPPIDEKRVLVLDARISDPDFPAVWRKVLKVNYVQRPLEFNRPGFARMNGDNYLQQLSRVLEALA